MPQRAIAGPVTDRQPITGLPESLETALLTSIRSVCLFLEQTRPVGWIDEIGCSLLRSLHPELEIAQGSIDALVVHPASDDKSKIMMGWIGGGSMTGCWIEFAGHIIDPFADERMRSKDPNQTESWFDLPIVIRRIETTGPLDIIYRRSGTFNPSVRHEAIRSLYDEFWARGPVAAPNKLRVLLSNRGLSHIADHSNWARAVLAADIKTPPLFPAHTQDDTRLGSANSRRPQFDQNQSSDITQMLIKKPIDWEHSAIAAACGTLLGVVILAGLKFLG